MIQEFNKREKFKVFVSRPYDKRNDPGRYWLNLFVNGIEPSAKLISEHQCPYTIEFYDASQNPDVDPIPGKVCKALDESDIFLCVLTEYRPCVLYETGYAQKLDLPSIFMLDQKDYGKHIPILIGVPDTYYYRGEEKNISLIASELMAYLIKACEAAELRRKRKKESHLGSVYEVKCYKYRDSLNFPELIIKSKRNIGILTTNIDYFVNPDPQTEYDHQFRLEYFEKALEREVKITILTMDPDSNLVLERSKQIDPQYKDDVYKYREELRQAIIRFYKHFTKPIQENKLILKLFDSLPSLMIYIVDNNVYVPSMVGHKRSRKCIHVEFMDDYPGVGETYIQHFEFVLREGKSIVNYSWIRDLS